MKKASPIILEPVGALNVTIPDALVGDVLSTIMKRRGRVLGMTHTGKKGYQMVEAEVPMGELADYTTALRAMSQGRGSYTLSFLRYEETPANIAEKIIAEEAKKRSED
jgi:elongation factor G